MTRIRTILAASVMAFGLSGAALAAGPSEFNTIDGLALHGFDPVAYFTVGKATKGSPSITTQYQGVTYEFANDANKTLFLKEPAKYVPAYNGFCAFAVTEGIKADIDPHAFAINNGKLYVNFSEAVRDDFQKDVHGNISKAETNWPAVQKTTKVYR